MLATPLPRLMVAPNGARLTDDDHPAVPVTIPQIVTTAQECASAGARAMHFHVRGDDKAHILMPACIVRRWASWRWLSPTCICRSPPKLSVAMARRICAT